MKHFIKMEPSRSSCLDEEVYRIATQLVAFNMSENNSSTTENDGYVVSLSNFELHSNISQDAVVNCGLRENMQFLHDTDNSYSFESIYNDKFCTGSSEHSTASSEYFLDSNFTRDDDQNTFSSSGGFQSISAYSSSSAFSLSEDYSNGTIQNVDENFVSSPCTEISALSNSRFALRNDLVFQADDYKLSEGSDNFHDGCRPKKKSDNLGRKSKSLLCDEYRLLYGLTSASTASCMDHCNPFHANVTSCKLASFDSVQRAYFSQNFTSLNDMPQNACTNDYVGIPSSVRNIFRSEQSIARCSGVGLASSVRGKLASFEIYLCNMKSSDLLSFELIYLSSKVSCHTSIKQISLGRYLIRYKPNFEGIHVASIFLNGNHIKGSPWTIEVTSNHQYQEKGNIRQMLGGNVNNSPNLNEPWGICCNTDGCVFVSDRSNHCIRVYNSDYSYAYSFGSQGGRPGEFNKPAGITLNSRGEIIVADKDNHRIQVLSLKGEVHLLFGKEGRNHGQLRYPWDAAVGPEDSILVSDSRNYRVCLFSCEGKFLQVINQECHLLKSPRGISFRKFDSKVIVTDMSKHQIIFLDLYGNYGNCERGLLEGGVFNRHPTVIGRKGSEPNEYCRPQGVACDAEGYIIIADNKNQRIQIVDSEGNYVCQWPVQTPSSERPSKPNGVAVSPSTGDILVVDAEFNRVLVY